MLLSIENSQFKVKMQDILEKLKTDFEYYTGGRYIGLVQAIGAGFASRLSEFASKLGFIEKQAFISTADKDYLYLHAGNLLEPKPSLIAEGYVVFFGQVGAIIPIDTQIQDDNNDFKTISQGEIIAYEFTGNVTVVDGVASLPPNTEVPSCICLVNSVLKTAISSQDSFSFEAGDLIDNEFVTVEVDKSGLILVKCTESGILGNRNLSDELKTKTTITGINKELGVINISGGEDAEAVEVYRDRVKYWLSNPQAPFSENHIRDFLLNGIPTLKYVWIKGGDLEEGKVKIFVLNQSDSLNQEEADKVIELVIVIKPAQMNPDFITTLVPTVNTTDVVIADLLPNHDEMKNEVRKNIEYLFNTDTFEKGISVNRIESTIYGTEFLGERVTSFSVVSGGFIATIDTYWKLEDVVFQ